ncbi:MAG: multidrug efflux RND transporter permease subunit [Phycisphaerales bacterium]|nr:multidrug efflux RND transporter permease subunit [Phycisphaerales bacterium]
MLSRFFIDRPVFSAVISLLIVLLGTVAIVRLPIDRYPQIVPPTIQISATYPGADAQTVAESVAAPIEQQLSGIPGLIYYSSTSANNGVASIVATFELGTDQELAAVDVQNRLSRAEPRLPQEVVRQGITVTKASTNILAVATLQSDDPRHDDVYLSNYATINLLDTLKRVPGVGDVIVFGSRDYAMRLWVDPDQLALRGMTVTDIARAVREQNAVFPAGTLAQRPLDPGVKPELTIPLITRGRLSDVADYENIIIRANTDGSMVRLKDIARVELGSQAYDLFGRVNGTPTALMLIYLQTGSNALDTIDSVRRALDDLSQTFPAGVHYRIPFDTTTFIRVSISEVVQTLVEAVLLVLAVVFLFLQNWRATLIPLLAIPVSIVGTFAGLLALGFSINTLTLFGLVLAIGIVVDDAIVVVENVERIMQQERLAPREATIKAMRQVTGPVIAIVLVLSAVFIPVAFLAGLTGQIYRQFAVTIAISVSISGLVALTLSPALCRLLLRPGHGRQHFPFRWFNSAFNAATAGYAHAVRATIRYAGVTLVVFAALGFATWRLSQRIPTGFLPSEDQGYVIAVAMLPDGASLDRTDALVRRGEAFFAAQPAVANVTVLGGLDILNGRTNSTNAAVMFITLKPFDQRKHPELSADRLVAAASREFFGPSAPTDGMIITLSPPPIQGLGIQAGFEMQLQSRGGETIEDLARVGNDFLAAARRDGRLINLNGTLRLGVPRLFMDLDRDKTKVLGVAVADVFETLQAYFGSLYVNDFNKFGRVWRVQLQAQPRFRDQPEDIQTIYVRNDHGEMVPVSGVVSATFRSGPNVVSHFNGFRTIQVTGAPGPGTSSGESLQIIRDLARTTLPPGYGFEWSGASYQEIKAGNQAPIVLAFGLLVVFLVLAAQYERWSLPIAVLLAVPLAVLGALVAILVRGFSQDIYFQIGLLTLVGLSAKNAILIVEFCVELHRQGIGLLDSAVQAARLRFRPIVMTSLAFILGAVPLALASGAGAAARHSIGTGVIGGMLTATFLAIFFVPTFFVIIQWAGDRVGLFFHSANPSATHHAPPPGHAAAHDPADRPAHRAS